MADRYIGTLITVLFTCKNGHVNILPWVVLPQRNNPTARRLAEEGTLKRISTIKYECPVCDAPVDGKPEIRSKEFFDMSALLKSANDAILSRS